jgi:adenylate kinase family enzyme
VIIIFDMKAIVLGNSGSGKTTFAHRLAEIHAADILHVDDVSFDEPGVLLPIDERVRRVFAWLAGRDRWIVEGCYGLIVEALLAKADVFFFLNPGVDVCLAHCRARPWEPDKFDSRAEQDAGLELLLQWVGDYETRSDEFGLVEHRRVFDKFRGRKHELCSVSEYDSVFNQ